MDVERIIRNTPATLTVTFYGDETPLDADSDLVTVTVKRADGTTLATGSATHVGSDNSGQYSYSLPPQANLNMLSVDWVGNFSGAPSTLRTYAEIVGGFYFTIAGLREYDSALADTTKFPLEKLQEARHAVEVEFEGICHRAFVPRFARETVKGDGYNSVYLEHPDITRILSVNGVAVVDDSIYEVEGHQLRYPTGSFSNGVNYTIEYEYGLDPTPTDIKEAAKRRARSNLLGSRSRIDERATLMQVPDFGTFNLATPGQRGSYTGLPNVDVVLDRWALGQGGVW